jgi:uncharacterized protein YuzE
MKILYDPERDILQISFNDSVVDETAQVARGLILDYDDDGHVIGMELRRASERVPNPYQAVFEVGMANLEKPQPHPGSK